jgi:hypothetical protein
MPRGEVVLTENHLPNGVLVDYGERFYRVISDAFAADTLVNDTPMIEAMEKLSDEQIAAMTICLHVLAERINFMADSLLNTAMRGSVHVKGQAFLDVCKSVSLPGLRQ